MDLMFWYALFAVTTSLTSIYEVWYPVMQQLEERNPKHNMIENKWTAYITFFLINIVLAPFILLPSIIPSWNERFKTALLEALQN